jgi:hypothetical protein
MPILEESCKFVTFLEGRGWFGDSSSRDAKNPVPDRPFTSQPPPQRAFGRFPHYSFREVICMDNVAGVSLLLVVLLKIPQLTLSAPRLRRMQDSFIL